MSAFWKYFLFLLWLSYSISCGILLFARGFFLHRQVLPHKNECAGQCNRVDGVITNPTKHEFCLLKDPYPGLVWKGFCRDNDIRVILVVIDALRYDFVEFNSDLNDSELLPFQNQLKVINDLLTSKPKNSKLFKFIADPPTTTLQRLLGLTTGSLPTFIDVGSNFASKEVNEDNIINQLLLKKKHLVMMGDDTWIRLYPSKFTREYPFDSFNVWDLDTLDNGVKKHLIPEVLKSDWSLLIAHFLGVDHCGHRYGPYHPEMTRKLSEMNDVLSDIVNSMDNRTVLFVIGDHGMTATGDHGGASEDELTAALFAYSTMDFYSAGLQRDTVSQVDLVPTLAALLGTAIPFSSLGSLIPDVLPIDNDELVKNTVWSNLKQVQSYLYEYIQNEVDLHLSVVEETEIEYQDLKRRFKNPTEDTDALIKSAQEFITAIRAHFVNIWAQFDQFAMTWGLIMTFLFLVLTYVIIECLPGNQLSCALSPEYFMITYGCMLGSAVFSWVTSQSQSNVSFDTMLYVTTCACSLICLNLLLFNNLLEILDLWCTTGSSSWTTFLCRLSFVLTLLAMASNSFVVAESSVLFLALSSVVFFLVFSYKLPKEERKVGSVKSVDKTWFGWIKVQVHPTRAKLVGIALLFCVILRVSRVFFRCRGQTSSQQTSFVMEDGNEGHSQLLNHDWLSLRMLLCTSLWVTMTRMWMRSCGNLTGFSMIVLLMKYVPTVLAVCSGAFWVLQGLPVDTKTPFVKPWQLQYLPLTAYILIAITVVCLVFTPLCVLAVPGNKHSTFVVNTHENAIPQLYNQIKKMMKNDDEKSDSTSDESPEEKPVVYGLATAYSAAFLVVASLFIPLLALLLGTQFAPSAVLMGASSIFLVGLLALVRFESAILPVQLIQVPWPAVMCWVYLAQYFFYGTGHQATFPNIHWDAAMVGTSGNFAGKHFLPATLVIINTFGSHIFAALMLPVLIIAPLTIRVMLRSLTPSVLNDREMKLGELMLFQKDFVLYRSLVSVCTKYVLLSAARVLACMVVATIHCRHLMAWEIFAPKLIFEGLSFLVSLPCILFAFLLVGRVTDSIQSLLARLESQTAQKSE